jgi:4-hydroxy-tetrahydrodipicolinate synthase
MFSGSIVALITPMHETGAVDHDCFRNLIEWHIASGTQAIVVNGTTGEGATLTPAERLELLTIAVQVTKGRVPIIAGTGTSSTAATIQETRAAASCGVDACMVVTPYYVRPTQHGLYEHYKAVAESTDLPILLYNVPKRTGCDIQPATVASLAHLSNIIGIKEATGDVMRVAAIRALTDERFILLSGDDETCVDFMRLGGQGVVSVVANIAPDLMQQMCAATLAGDLATANKINIKLAPLYAASMAEPNPIPTKWAMHKLGKIPAGIRLPLTTLSEPFHAMMSAALDNIFPEPPIELEVEAAG